MSFEIAGIAILWTFLFGYLIVASIDFGAGFFSFYSILTGHENKIHNIIQRYLSPVWEVTNVFLIFLWLDWSDFIRTAPFITGQPCWCRVPWPLYYLRSEACITPTIPMEIMGRTAGSIWHCTERRDC